MGPEDDDFFPEYDHFGAFGDKWEWGQDKEDGKGDLFDHSFKYLDEEEGGD